jgi:hypothetical protein
MAELNPSPTMTELRITASLRHGVVMNRNGGIAFDGLLASATRTRAADTQRPSALDGGQHTLRPCEWELPLATCAPAGTTDWHWLATEGLPINADGTLCAADPEIHYTLQRARTHRWRAAAVKTPAQVPHRKGRYQTRLTPTIALPAAAVEWHVVGNRTAITDLLTTIHSIGGQRHTGEGVVTAWTVTPVADPHPAHGHLHRNGAPGRPLLPACWQTCNLQNPTTVTAGIRPPLWHPFLQRAMYVTTETRR